MRTDTPQTIYLKDYKPYPFTIKSLNMNFDIHDGYTVVTAKSFYERDNENAKEIFLNGEDLELLSISIDGQEVQDYKKDDVSIRIPCSSDSFELGIKTKIYPEKNTRLEGLYNSGGTYCTQCEAEGFRRITYYPDRPDVLTTFTVRVEADKAYPVLLSNGNRIDGGEVDGNRHFTVWEDPFPKPCYLFALVAGDLTHIQDQFVTESGREVDLYIYVRHGDETQCDHAMDSLKRSMKWDEEVYGLEYELDIFNIVAVSDFNMGAMENTSLNIFNTALVLAQQETATDTDFMRVEGVIAHEYFHNWSGNRVTCRDWFQLSLKEGLTVFRDQEFSADTHSHEVQRIDDVAHLRRFQFSEDAGALAHPVRPDNYIEINNFYTMTIYEKGAEVIRMMRTILGKENYRKGTDLYFERHDGQAVTCEDFVKALEDASGEDLTQFRLWYEQAGTPEVTFAGEYNLAENTYTATFSQIIPDTPNQTNKKPMVIPISIGLLDKEGEDLIGTKVLMLTQSEQSFTFDNIQQKPVPSILRGFSAPVRLKTDLTKDDYTFLRTHDVYDGFNRWEAGQTLVSKVILDALDASEGGAKVEIPQGFIDGYAGIFEDALKDGADKALLARAMSIPSVSALIQECNLADPERIDNVREKVLASIKRTHKPLLERIYKNNELNGSFQITADAMAQRALRNTVISLLTATHGTGCAKLAKQHYDNADNMTDRVAALSSLASNKNEERASAFADFYDRFNEYQLVIDKWFALQASSGLPDTVEHLKRLREHKDFNIKNPNRVRSLYSAFAMNNPVRFHAADGSGYAFVRDGIIELNAINPQIAARLLTPMREWRRFSEDRQVLIKQALSDILEIKDIAPDVYEIARKSLEA